MTLGTIRNRLQSNIFVAFAFQLPHGSVCSNFICLIFTSKSDGTLTQTTQMSIQMMKLSYLHINKESSEPQQQQQQMYTHPMSTLSCTTFQDATSRWITIAH